MDSVKQFETMAALRAYAERMIQAAPGDVRPSVAKYSYADVVARMAELVKQLETRS
jgi:hypothetical protein